MRIALLSVGMGAARPTTVASAMGTRLGCARDQTARAKIDAVSAKLLKIHDLLNICCKGRSGTEQTESGISLCIGSGFPLFRCLRVPSKQFDGFPNTPATADKFPRVAYRGGPGMGDRAGPNFCPARAAPPAPHFPSNKAAS